MSAKPRPKPVRVGLVLTLVAGLTVLPIAVCIGWCAYGDDIRQYLNRKPFDPAVWKQTPDSDRYDLAWDLEPIRKLALRRGRLSS